MKQCISCGREIEDTTNICPYCGMQQKKDPKTVAVIVIAGVIAILLLLLFLVLSLKSLFTKQIENTIAEGQSYMKNTTSASNVVVNEITNQVSNETSNELTNQIVNATSNETNSSILQQPSYNSYPSFISSVSNTLNSQNVQNQNSKFESYFGTEVSALEVKALLSEIRTNNLVTSRNDELTTIGVCYFTKNDILYPPVGCYTYRIDNIKSADFDSCYFTPDAQAIYNVVQAGSTYSVNVPNSNECKLDIDGITGFENEENSDGQAVLGFSGGYYSSGYIRLIYIYEN